MIRNVIVHLINEQPLVADLFEMPAPADVGLLCTNLRTLDGKRPVFIDAIDSIFFFPYLHVRFVEIPPGAMAGERRRRARPSAGDASDDGPHGHGAPPAGTRAEPDLEIDEDFLRRDPRGLSQAGQGA